MFSHRSRTYDHPVTTPDCLQLSYKRMAGAQLIKVPNRLCRLMKNILVIYSTGLKFTSTYISLVKKEYLSVKRGYSFMFSFSDR